MRLDTLAQQATAITAIITLVTSIGYGSVVLWGVAHAQYASASAVEYLYRKQIELDIWRYHDEQAELEDILATEELSPRAEAKATVLTHPGLPPALAISFQPLQEQVPDADEPALLLGNMSTDHQPALQMAIPIDSEDEVLYSGDDSDVA